MHYIVVYIIDILRQGGIHRVVASVQVHYFISMDSEPIYLNATNSSIVIVTYWHHS